MMFLGMLVERANEASVPGEDSDESSKGEKKGKDFHR